MNDPRLTVLSLWNVIAISRAPDRRRSRPWLDKLARRRAFCLAAHIGGTERGGQTGRTYTSSRETG
jgi:hypothetical protein